MLTVSSVNVNGIRAAHRKGFTDWAEQSDPDIICLQELRALKEQVPAAVRALDYHEAYHIAEKKGYSGVGIYSRRKPIHVVKGMGLDWVDSEGREWMSRLLESGFEDVYRRLHEGEPDLYSWWSYRAASKERNKGWRIDYHMSSPGLLEAAEEAIIEREWDLSDHAPVTVTYRL